MVREVTKACLVSYVKNIYLFKRKYRNECEADILIHVLSFSCLQKVICSKMTIAWMVARCFCYTGLSATVGYYITLFTWLYSVVMKKVDIDNIKSINYGSAIKNNFNFSTKKRRPLFCKSLYRVHCHCIQLHFVYM